LGKELPAHPLAREGVDESGETEHVCLLACPALAVRAVMAIQGVLDVSVQRLGVSPELSVDAVVVITRALGATLAGSDRARAVRR